MFKKRTLIVIGGTGFLGFHILKFFSKKKWRIISVSRKKANRSRFIKKRVKYVYADISKLNKLRSKLKKYKKIDFIINSGGEVDHKNKKKVFSSHFLGVKNLCIIANEKKIKRFIQFGSSLEYGKIRSPHKESFKCLPISDYAKAKYLATKHLINLRSKNNFPALVVRPYQVYGPQQDINRFIPIVIKHCLTNEKFPCSNGIQSRDFLYITDFVKCVYKLLLIKDMPPQIINIGSGKVKKILNVIKFIKRIIKKGKPEFGKIKLRKEENLLTYPNTKILKKTINFTSVISFEKGIKKTINYYKRII